MIKAVIFDMDGVVVNTEPLGHAANQEMYKSLGISVPDEVYNTFIGNSDKNIVHKLKNLYPQLTLSDEELLEEKYKYYFAAFDASTDLDLMQGVREFIIDLHSNGIKLLLASSSAKRKIERVYPFRAAPVF